MVVAKLTRVLDKLLNGCSVVVHDNKVLFGLPVIVHNIFL